MFRVVGTYRHHDPAAVRPLQAEADILEGPAFAGALVVDGQASVLQSKLAKVMTAEAGFAEAVDPGQ